MGRQLVGVRHTYSVYVAVNLGRSQQNDAVDALNRICEKRGATLTSNRLGRSSGRYGDNEDLPKVDFAKELILVSCWTTSDLGRDLYSRWGGLCEKCCTSVFNRVDCLVVEVISEVASVNWTAIHGTASKATEFTSKRFIP